MKHKLRIEDLAVTSFDAASAPEETRGTVRANQSDPDTCYPVVCASGEWSCLESCQDTCGLSCNGTCLPAYCTTDGI